MFNYVISDCEKQQKVAFTHLGLVSFVAVLRHYHMYKSVHNKLGCVKYRIKLSRQSDRLLAV